MSNSFSRWVMERKPDDLFSAIAFEVTRRGHFKPNSMEMIPGEKRAFGACDIEIEDNKVERRPEIRGDIARTYRYMHQAYPGRDIISRSNEKRFEAWDKLDSIDDGKRERARRIERIQGNPNPVIFPDGGGAAPSPTPLSDAPMIGSRRNSIYHRPDYVYIQKRPTTANASHEDDILA